MALRLRVSHFGRVWHPGSVLHAATHVIPFAVISAFLMVSSTSRHHRWLSFFAVLLLAFGTEYYEHLRDGFPVEMPDVLADTAGAAAAFAVVAALPRPARPSASRGLP